MSADFIRTLLIMSIIGGGVVLVLFALKPLLKNCVSKTAQYYIWLAPVVILLTLFRITIPAAWTPAEVVNIPSVRDVVEERVVTTTELISRIYAEGAAPSQEVVQYAKQNSPYHIWILTAEVIWPTGAIIFLLWTLTAYLRLTMRLRDGLSHFECDVPRRVKVFTHPAVQTPMLMGLFRPRIILPQREYAPEELQNILAHELTHYRRHDVALKWLVVVAGALHWFNPVVYFMRREFNRACELSCDEAVIRKLDEAAKQSYGDTLIAVVAENRVPSGVMSVTMCEEKKKLKERLVAIMNYKKKTKIAVLITVILAVVITGSAFAFGAQSGDFKFWKPSSYSVTFPYEKASDISTLDMTRLIKETTKTTGNIYINPVPQNINLNADFSFRDVTIEVFITENGWDGYPNYRSYHIFITAEGKMMKIFPKSIESIKSGNSLAHFDAYWNALSSLPTDAIYATIPKDAPDFISLRYTPHDVYAVSAPNIKHIFYNTDGIIDSYLESPSIMFDFIPMHQVENEPNAYDGIGAAILYYYHPQDVEVESPATRGEESNNLEIARVVISVTIDHSLNWNNMYPRIYTSGEKINAVLDYMDELTLTDDFPEIPDEYNGSTSTITILFDDGTKAVYYHFGNMFFGKATENGIDWKRMEYEEAAKFDTIIQNNLSD